MGDDLHEAAERVRKAKEELERVAPHVQAAGETLDGWMRQREKARAELRDAEGELCRIARGDPPKTEMPPVEGNGGEDVGLAEYVRQQVAFDALRREHPERYR